jgi:hypothetical protein
MAEEMALAGCLFMTVSTRSAMRDFGTAERVIRVDALSQAMSR